MAREQRFDASYLGFLGIFFSRAAHDECTNWQLFARQALGFYSCRIPAPAGDAWVLFPNPAVTEGFIPRLES